ncbi:ATP-binding protein [Actinocrispum wychmicini]|uniref:Regulatory LuxR family protein n=1 Tax=Actinocrispum wychmicini TaxID=1213861 RepID=A0A4R2JCA2_9PSEU|nr:LuxR family transcriptional regulator [Actinocrispum wychmicini]TCO56057.1 regulatory LuxR family protein [Actinocrispum wychmicini]
MTRFVGRAGEFAALMDLLDRAGRGGTGFALVSGEPGMGKTRLMTELGRTAGSRGWTVRRGRASDEDGAPGFWLWRQVLEFATGDAPVSAEQRFAVFDRIGRSLAATPTPTLIVLDDLHWADAGSLALFEHLVRGQYDGRLMIVGGLRPAEFATRAHGNRLRALVGRHDNGVELRLTGLSTAEVGALLGNQPDAEAVRARTLGNPLFVLEVGRLAADEPLPEVIRDAIHQHLAVLDADCLRTLTTAAVMGSVIDVDALAMITDADVRTVLSHVDHAVAAGVLTSEREFQHDLFQEALRLDLSISDRSAIHLRVAECLPESRLAEIARHRLAALPLGDAALACASARAAGHAALADLAFENAAGLFDRALAAAPDDLPSAARCALLIDASRSHFFQGDTAGAQQRCVSAAQLAQRTGDAEHLGRVALALPEVSDPAWVPLVEAWCEQALNGLPPDDSSLRAQVLAQYALTLVHRDDPERIIAVSDAAYAMARRLDDTVATRIALRAKQLAHSAAHGHLERLSVGSEMVTLGRVTGDLDAMFWGHLWRFDAMVQAGRVPAADAEVAMVEPVAARLGNPSVRWQLVRSRNALAVARGRFTVAARLIDEIRLLRPQSVFWAGQSMLLSRLTGDHVDPDSWELPPADHPLGVASQFLHTAPWLLAFGRTDEAADIYQRFPTTIRLPQYMALLVTAVHGATAAALGDKAAASRDYEALSPHADLHVTTGAGLQITLGSTHHYLGLTAEGDTAIDHFRAAVAANDEAGLLPYAAQSRYELARALCEKGASGEARQHVRAAAATAKRLGMLLLAGQVSALDSRLADHPLTPRQVEVAGLVAKGYTNKQLAAALHIAERTAESHVQNIMTTLGFQSRSQIATWSTQHQGPPR